MSIDDFINKYSLESGLDMENIRRTLLYYLTSYLFIFFIFICKVINIKFNLYRLYYYIWIKLLKTGLKFYHDES